MLAIRMSNQPLNPISYSQLIGWFPWICRDEVKYFQNNFFHLKLLGKFDLYALKKIVSKKFRSWLGSWWAAKSFRSEGFQHNDLIISLARGVTKLFGKSPLQQSKDVKLENSVTNSTNFNAKVNYSANVTFSV